MTEGIQTIPPRPKKVVVVGPCASGKTTLVGRLRDCGYDAYVCGQEHSVISNLWQHLHPDVMIALHVDLESIRKRRGDSWSARLYETQIDRLSVAMSKAGLVIDTSVHSEEATQRLAIRFLESGSGSE